MLNQTYKGNFSFITLVSLSFSLFYNKKKINYSFIRIVGKAKERNRFRCLNGHGQFHQSNGFSKSSDLSFNTEIQL